MYALDSRISRRHSALQALLIATIPGAIFFAYINFSLGAPLLACLNLLSLASSYLLYKRIEKFSLEVAALVYLSLLFINILTALARPDIHPGTTSWITVIPVCSYLLLPTRLALPTTFAALIGAIIAYYIGTSFAPYRLGSMLILHIFFPVAGIFIVCHFYTRSQFKTDKTLMEKVFLDPLTGLWNREKLMQDFEIEKKQAAITGIPLALILIDLDDFKLINDNHGHDTGDAALLSFANLLKRHMQGTDSIYRFGGEEFAIILKNTDASVAKRKTEEIRKALEKKTITHRETTLNITLSAGIAELGRDGQDWQAMYHSADKRLYACKRNGRNCVDNGTSV